MPDEVIRSINRMEEALARLSRADAETIAADAAARAEAVADYAARIGRAENQPG